MAAQRDRLRRQAESLLVGRQVALAAESREPLEVPPEAEWELLAAPQEAPEVAGQRRAVVAVAP
ncbi:MAG: hypothetical protein QNJ62_06975 [Methyloceanibacter sp.]|nr:hypothetical protein [Methyloceanibacter sp.]